MVDIVGEFQWREKSYGFQVGGVLFVAFVSEAFFGLKNEKDCRECNVTLLLRWTANESLTRVTFRL